MNAIRRLSTEFSAMGCQCYLSFYVGGDADPGSVAEIAIGEVRRIETRYSRYRSDNLLSRINRAAEMGGIVEVDEETSNLLDLALDAYEKSGGLFDITSGLLRRIWKEQIEDVPSDADISALIVRIGLDKIEWKRPRLTFTIPGMELDLGGVGKEYAADRAAEVLRSLGIAHGLVDLGGDIALVGAHPDGSPWRIGIRDPDGSPDAVATLFLSGGGVATSGSYERFWEFSGRRFSHILNPKTGWPVEGLPSVTVVEDTCLKAGIASTIALLSGEGGAEWLRRSGTAHLFVDASGSLAGSIPLGR